jgi:hypothetical protein
VAAPRRFISYRRVGCLSMRAEAFVLGGQMEPAGLLVGVDDWTIRDSK